MLSPSLSARSSFESLHSNSSSVVSSPDRLPPPVTGPMVWEGKELDPAEYVVHLSEGEVRDIRAAIIKFKLTGLARSDINIDTFDLGNAKLASKLASLSKRIHQGRGVVVLRGLDTAYFNDEEAVIAFAGVCSYVCPERATDSYANQTLSHVLDATKKPVPAECKGIGLAGSKVTDAMDFHSDRFSGDVLALYVRNDGGPNAGGEQFVVSFARIYNELLETDPEVLETLAEANWPFELKQKNGSPYISYGPILFFSHDNDERQSRPICQLVKAPLLGTPSLPRATHLPCLDPRQHAALARVEQLARKYSHQLCRRQGDIQLVHNLSVMHARAAYRRSSSDICVDLSAPGTPASLPSSSSSSSPAAATVHTSTSTSTRRPTITSPSTTTSTRTAEQQKNAAPSTRHLLRMFLRDPAYAWDKPARARASFDDPFAPGRPQNLPVYDSDPWRIISGRESHG